MPFLVANLKLASNVSIKIHFAFKVYCLAYVDACIHTTRTYSSMEYARINFDPVPAHLDMFKHIRNSFGIVGYLFCFFCGLFRFLYSVNHCSSVFSHFLGFFDALRRFFSCWNKGHACLQ